MVNLKKIGVIAASALFVGATLGTASAVTFSSDMLVKNNVAVAKIVTGTKNPDATGLTADEASAKVISDKVSATFKVTTGAGISFTYDGQDIDDVDTGRKASATPTDGDVVASSTSNTWDEKWLIKDLANATIEVNEQLWGYNATYLSATNTTEYYGIMYDATGDGDVKDSDDYPIYNDIQIEDRTLTDITIKPVMRVGNGTYLKEKVIELKGQKYLVKDFKTDTDTIELVPVSEKTVVEAANTGQIIDSAVTIPGTDIRIGVTNVNVGVGGSQTNATFAIVEAGAITKYETRNNETTDKKLALYNDLELVSGYYTYVTGITSDSVKLAIGKEADKFAIHDGDEDVLGYAKAVVDDDDGWAASGSAEVRLEDSSITIGKDSKERIGATYVYAKYDKDKKFDLVSEKTKTAASGSKLKYTVDPWDDFLNIDVIVSATGGVTTPVTVATVKDTAVTASDKAGFNLVLVGGPVANTLTAELVTAGKSKVDWYASAGEYEVVSDAFATGKYAIIVAGKTRTETAAAASALAALI